MSETESKYFEGRLTAEREAEAHAKSDAAKAAHKALAEHYESRLKDTKPRSRTAADQSQQP